MTDKLPPGSRVVAYLRDSGGPDQDRSIEQQQQVVEAFCQKHALILVQLYIDEAPAGSTRDRLAFQNMIADLRALAPEPERGDRDPRALDGVLYWDLKRFARNQNDSAYYRADLRRRGYTLVSLSDTIPSGDMAPIVESLLAWKAQQDRADLSKDIRRGLHSLVTTRGDDGQYIGLQPSRPAAGFRGEPYQLGTKRDGSQRIVQRWVPDKGGTWELVQQAFQMFADGATLKQIHSATHLFTTFTSYYDMFRRRIYTGDLEYGGEIYHDWIERCIEPDLWARVRALCQSRVQNHAPRLGTAGYTLSGWLRCELCSGSMIGSRSTVHHKGKTYPYRRYVCANAKNKTASHSPVYYQAEPIELAVYQVLSLQVLQTDILVECLSDVDVLTAERQAAQQQLASLQSDLRATENTIERLVAAIESGGQLPALLKRLRQREAERGELQQQIATHNALMQPTSHITPDILTDFCRNARDALAHGDVHAVRQVINSVVARINISPDKTGELWYTAPGSQSAQMVPFTF